MSRCVAQLCESALEQPRGRAANDNEDLNPIGTIGTHYKNIAYCTDQTEF